MGKRGRVSRRRRRHLDRFDAERPGYVRDVQLVYRWTKVPQWMDTMKPISCSRDAWPYFRPLERRVREAVIALYVNGAHIPIAREVVHVGTMKECYMDAGEICRTALHLGARGVIVAHNHPSGCLHQSPQDEVEFDRLKNAAHPVGVNILDSLIIVPGRYLSLADDRAMKQSLAL